ncbi:DnaT-like ssDNA-binding domain-containing protein [Pseudomonas sp.]|uniref:DnaT-like ssDNA-binding domain-containing protein n=1 Tax=Pseudomonas sp. TaxID=306 RepID=UPI002898DF1C|nr:DnaT-like ssDNA-binding domain-containing protein [Pseudomonas sp.]
MARIRTIKPEFWTSEQVMECQPLTRLMFIGLWNFCDDGGNHPASAKTIKALLFPGDDISTAGISRMIEELRVNQLLSVYEANGKQYLHVNGWRHQKIDKPTFKYPRFQSEFGEDSLNGSGGLGEDSSNDSRGLGDGRVKEGEGYISHTHSGPFALTLSWIPDATMLKTYALMSGLSESLFTKEAMAPYICHHEAKGLVKSEKEWVSGLVAWVKRDKQRDSRVVRMPVRQANGPDFDSTDWANDLGDL